MTKRLPSDTAISSNLRGLGKVWNSSKSNMNECWTRLLKDYLPTHKLRRKQSSNVVGIEVMDMVWILEKETPGGIWPVGTVQKINKASEKFLPG